MKSAGMTSDIDGVPPSAEVLAADGLRLEAVLAQILGRSNWIIGWLAVTVIAAMLGLSLAVAADEGNSVVAWWMACAAAAVVAAAVAAAFAAAAVALRFARAVAAALVVIAAPLLAMVATAVVGAWLVDALVAVFLGCLAGAIVLGVYAVLGVNIALINSPAGATEQSTRP